MNTDRDVERAMRDASKRLRAGIESGDSAAITQARADYDAAVDSTMYAIAFDDGRAFQRAQDDPYRNDRRSIPSDRYEETSEADQRASFERDVATIEQNRAE